MTKLRDADQDYMASMRSIGVPVLLTWFSNDSYCTVESCEALARLVPARVEELPGTLGHNRWAREPQDVTDRLDAFVAAL